MIQEPNSRLAENITATENAISAVTKIIQYNGSNVGLDQRSIYFEHLFYKLFIQQTD